MNINYDYQTFEDKLRAQYKAYNQVIEKRATKSILNSAVDLFDQQLYDLCLKIAEELEKTATNDKDLYDAKKLIALCHYAKQDRAKSDEAFFELTRNSQNSDDWFNAVIAAAINENYERSEALFAQALQIYADHGTAKNMPSVQLIFHYLLALQQNEAYELSYEKFNLLRQVYEQVDSSDEKTLNQRGLNSLSVFLESAKETLVNIDKKERDVMFEEFRTKMDERGKLEISNFLDTL